MVSQDKFNRNGLLIPTPRLPKTSLGRCCCGSSGSSGPSPSANPVFVAAHIFVSSSATFAGARERLDLPFSTLQGALAVAQDGDTIVLLTPLTSNTPADLPAVANLAILGWGGANNIVLNHTGPGPAIRTVNAAPQGLSIQDLQVKIASASLAFDFGDVAADTFAGEGLSMVNVVTTGKTRIRRAGKALVQQAQLGDLIVAGSADLEVRNTNLRDATLDYLSPGATYAAAGGRLGYRFANVQVNALQLNGAIGFASDPSSRILTVTGDLQSDAGSGLNPSVRIASTLGGNPTVGNHEETGRLDTSATRATFNFANVAWEAAGAYLSGVDLTGSTVYGNIEFNFLFVLTAALEGRSFFFGGDRCTVLGHISAQSPNPVNPTDPRYLVTFRNSELGRADSTATPSFTITNVNADIRKSNVNMFLAAGGTGGGFDLDSIAYGTTGLNAGAGTIAVSPRLASYLSVTNFITVITPPVAGAATGVQANLNTNLTVIDYSTTGAGNCTVALLRV